MALPEQVATAATSVTGGIDGLPAREQVAHVLALGMGGSGIAGDVLSVVAGPFVPVPIVVSKDYELPGFVGERTLVFAISFSGNSEETVESATQAAALGARVVAVCEGGELARLAEQWGGAVLRIPPGIPMPRAGIGALAIPPLLVLEQIGLFPGARRVDQRGRRPARSPARPARDAEQRGRERSPASSVARSRSSTAPDRSVRSPRCVGRPTSTRTRRRPRWPTGCRSCVTTRSRDGASTAT